jgi:hypothetical protein
MGGLTEQIAFRQEDWLAKAGDLWCSFMHASPKWPIHGQYQCGVCGRRFQVPWEEDRSVPAHAAPLGFGPALASIRK